MTAKEVRDNFVLKYKIECVKRKIQQIELQDKVLALLISEAWQDISAKLHVLETYTDITLEISTEFNTYGLPDNFGGLKGKPKIGDNELTVVNMSDLPQTGTLESGVPEKCATYHDGTGWKLYVYPLPSSADSLRVWYKIDTSLYSPSGESEFESFDGANYGDCPLPQRYLKATVLYMLGEFFDDKKAEYLMELSSLRGNSMTSVDDTVKYDIGGGISFE